MMFVTWKHVLEIEKCRSFRNVMRFNLVHLCPFMLLLPSAVFMLCCSTVLSGYCNVSFYFLGNLGKKRKGRHLSSGSSTGALIGDTVN